MVIFIYLDGLWIEKGLSCSYNGIQNSLFVVTEVFWLKFYLCFESFECRLNEIHYQQFSV